jgi:hypothetical protein
MERMIRLKESVDNLEKKDEGFATTAKKSEGAAQ